MSIKEDWNRGTKFENHFNNLAKKACTLVGKLRRIAIYELDDAGNAFYASNRPDVAEEALDKKYFLYQANWQYMSEFKPRIQTFSTQFGHEDSKVYQDKFKCTSVYLREQVDEHTQLITLFNSTNPTMLINALANDLVSIKKLFKFFKDESKHVIDYHKDHKFNIASERPGYFATERDTNRADVEKLNYWLHTMGVLDKNKRLTVKEFQCLELHNSCKSANQIAEILNISRRTVEVHFVNIKRKLNVSSKYELSDLLK